MDDKTQDLLHEIELNKFCAVTGYKLSKEIQETRKKRREAKDENELLEKVHEYFKRYPKMRNELYKIKSEIKKQEKHHQSRTYKNRFNP